MAQSPPPEYDIRHRAEWIQRLLYAPDSHGRLKRPIFGKTRMMKACFLIHKKLQEEHGVEKTGFSFRPDKYGPLDPEVYSALGLLQNEDKIRIVDSEEHDSQYDAVKYVLTPEGVESAENLYSDLPEGQQRLVEWVKSEHAMKRLGELLTYVYDQYPEMTTKSELV